MRIKEKKELLTFYQFFQLFFFQSPFICDFFNISVLIYVTFYICVEMTEITDISFLF